MKNLSLIMFRHAVGAGLALWAVTGPLGAGDAPDAKPDVRVLVEKRDDQNEVSWVHRDDAADPGPSTFLGVETTKVGATLGKQLGLDRGVGLVVARVVPGSGAAEVLQKHDLLVQFEDQLLISAEQLGVLVKSKEPGTAVDLTIVRGGERLVVTATLGQRQKKAEMIIKHGQHAPHPDLSREEVTRLVEKVRGGNFEQVYPSNDGKHTAVRVMHINTGAVVFTDNEGTVKLISGEDSKRLVVLDPEDNILFDGPVDTEAQRDALDDGVKARLQKVESLRALEMPDEGFEIEEDVRVLVPHASVDVREQPGRAGGMSAAGGVPQKSGPGIGAATLTTQRLN